MENQEPLYRLYSPYAASNELIDSLHPYSQKIEAVLEAPIGNIPLIVSKKDLSPWEMACCFVDGDFGEIQLHPKLIQYSHSLWRLSSYAIILHEYVHAIRAPLHSIKYEEYIAYRVSREQVSSHIDRVRCFFGPLFESAGEVYLFFALYFFALFVSILLSFNPFFQSSMPLLLISPLICRLIFKNRRVAKIHALLKIDLKSKEKATSLLIRLTDSDIDEILKISREDGFFSILSYKIADRRWDWIRGRYAT
ncbi:MAG: hypothetical protein QRY74_04975 [Chlamydia sp.]